jgi:uncharacterized repeat protein (TIGR03803 family)
MITRQVKHVVVFALAPGVVMAAIPRGIAASSTSTIYSFGTTQPIDGGVPKGSLIYVNGLLFGRTTIAIAATPTPIATPTPTPIGSYGVIFHFDPNNVASSYSIDHVFAGHDADDGDNPRHDAMTPFNGLLYGTTLDGGTNNTGIIFSIGQDGTGYQELFSLAKHTGDKSHSCFVADDNILYGMTASGGDSDQGVIFSFNPATSSFQDLYAFPCTPPLGAEPHGRLTLDPNGTTCMGWRARAATTTLASCSASTRAAIITLSCTTLLVDMTTARRAITVTLFSRVTISRVWQPTAGIIMTE